MGIGMEKTVFEQLLQAAADATHCPHFAAMLGIQQNINLLGVVGDLMLQSNDVRTALLELVDHLLLHIQGPINGALQCFGNQAYLSYHNASQTQLRKQSDELAMAKHLNFTSLLIINHRFKSA